MRVKMMFCSTEGFVRPQRAHSFCIIGVLSSSDDTVPYLDIRFFETLEKNSMGHDVGSGIVEMTLHIECV